MDVDLEGKRLFVAGVENGSMEIVDLTTGKWVRSIPGFKTPTEMCYVRELNKIFVASRDDGMVRVFRGDSLELIDSIKLELGANRIVYDPARKYLYVGYGAKLAGFDYGRVGIIDARSDKLLGDMIVEAHPSQILLDNAAHRILVAVWEVGKIDVFDAIDHQMLMTWTTGGQSGDMALDHAHHRLFTATRTAPPSHPAFVDHQPRFQIFTAQVRRPEQRPLAFPTREPRHRNDSIAVPKMTYQRRPP